MIPRRSLRISLAFSMALITTICVEQTRLRVAPVTFMIQQSQHVRQSTIQVNEESDSYISQNSYIYKPGLWDGAPIVLKKYKLIFFTIPKVGCTVFKQLFRRMAGYPNWRKLGGSGMPHNPHVNGLKYLYNYSINEATSMLKAEDWTRAIFVRDPKERFVSAYLDKAVRKGGMYVNRHCCPSCGNESSTLVGFLGVMQQCVDPHWMPQSNRMERRFWETINFVGHIETAAADAKELLERLGAWEDFGITGWGSSGEESIFQSLSNVKHSTAAVTRLLEFFDNNTESLANEYYKDDYANEKMGFVQKRIVGIE